MWRFSTYRRSCSFRAADAAISGHPSWKESAGVPWDAGRAGGDLGYWPAIRSAAFSAMASTVACRGALGMTGITDASATRSPVIPRTRSWGRPPRRRRCPGRSGRCRPGGSSCRPCRRIQSRSPARVRTPGPGATSAARDAARSGAGGGLADHRQARPPAGPGRAGRAGSRGRSAGPPAGRPRPAGPSPGCPGRPPRPPGQTRGRRPGTRPGRRAAGSGTGAGRARRPASGLRSAAYTSPWLYRLRGSGAGEA